ncbi:hypothetical protein [Brevibacillus formosus]
MEIQAKGRSLLASHSLTSVVFPEPAGAGHKKTRHAGVFSFWWQ